MEPSITTIILGEDDDGHAHLICKNLERAGFDGQVVRCEDGQEVLRYLSEQPRPVGAGSRRLLVLDINMPKLDGIGVLERLRQDPEHQRLPVIMLTTSDSPQEVQRCYELGCNVYVTKPVVYDEFVEAMQRLGRFLKIARFPEDAGRDD
ncbi:MAG: response regulator [Planctomycetota bacterium]